MKILVIGSGAREHAILRSLSLETDSNNKSPEHKLFVVGGNPGIWELAEQIVDSEGQNISETDGNKIGQFCLDNNIQLVVVGPEAPLAVGVVDQIKSVSHQTAVFGPSKDAAMLEASKSFAKEVMECAGVPTAKAVICKNMSELVAALNEADNSVPYVVKADGLAAGKGVIVTKKKSEAEAHASAVFHSGGFVILEDYLAGPEFSMFFICDGQTAIPLMPAQDYKRIYDSDEGPNTGGMGSYIPLKWLNDNSDEALENDYKMKWCTQKIALPVLREMKKRGTPFVGVLFAGLVQTSSGVKVIEFNVRFGDPETQVVLEKLNSKLSELLYNASNGELNAEMTLKWDNFAYCNVVLASQGYPETSHKGDLIDGINGVKAKGAVVLEAGTAYSPADIGAIVTNGGRVLSVITKDKNLQTAREKCYNAVKQISFNGMQYRTDIAKDR